jgi:hypothetical protein
MRTTLDLDDDILQAVKELGQLQRKTAGQILSELARKALEPDPTIRIRNGVPLLPHRPGAPRMTVEDVERLLDEE